MKRRSSRVRSLLILICLLIAPAGLSARQNQGSGRPPLVVISVDGAADWLLDEMLERGELPAGGGFARLSARGARAAALRPINVASTQPVHATLITGRRPAGTGIVGSSFLSGGRRVSGFGSPIDGEPIWSLAMRMGRRVTCVAFPFADLSTPERSCTRTLPFGVTETQEGRSFDLRAGASGVPGGSRRLLPSGEAPHVAIGGRVLTLVATTVSDGGRRAIRIRAAEGAVEGPPTTLVPGEIAWVRLPTADRRLQVPVMLQGEADDMERVRLYVGLVSGTPAGAASRDPFVREMDERLGLFPPDVDYEALLHGQISAAEWEAQNDAIASYLQAAVLTQLRRQDWDLLLAYFPTVDNAEHRFLLTDPRQPDFNALEGGRRRAYRERLVRAYRRMDTILASFIAAAPAGTNFLVVSDHGSVPSHSTILLHNYLEALGYSVSSDASDLTIVPRQADADIYLSRQMSAEARAAMVERIAAALRRWTDPRTNEPVFQIVAARQESGALGIFHPGHSGDIFVSTRPGYGVYRRHVPGAPVLVPTSSEPDTLARLIREDPRREPVYRLARQFDLTPGLHGHLGQLRMIEGIFIASGPDLRAEALGVVEATDVAPTIAALLGLPPLRGAEGRALPAVTR